MFQAEIENPPKLCGVINEVMRESDEEILVEEVHALDLKVIKNFLVPTVTLGLTFILLFSG